VRSSCTSCPPTAALSTTHGGLYITFFVPISISGSQYFSRCSFLFSNSISSSFSNESLVGRTPLSHCSPCFVSLNEGELSASPQQQPHCGLRSNPALHLRYRSSFSLSNLICSTRRVISPRRLGFQDFDEAMITTRSLCAVFIAEPTVLSSLVGAVISEATNAVEGTLTAEILCYCQRGVRGALPTRAICACSPLMSCWRMLGQLDAGRQPTGMLMFFGGSCSTGFRYSTAVHLLLGPIAELKTREILNIYM
jgi:hypothetical protein